jgi:GNAT superfamily N-acetyltransferase
VTVPGDAHGVAVLAASARAALVARCGAGDGAGLVVRQMAADAQRRLGGGVEAATLRLEGAVRGTEYVLTMHDFGEPVVGPAEGVLALLQAGVLSAAEARIDGAGNVAEVRFALPAHNHLLDVEDVGVVPDDAPPSEEKVVLRPLTPEDAPALARALYRCYGWSYPNPAMYYPERVAAMLQSGERIGEVAVTSDGEVAAHWGAAFLSPSVVETGVTITDPRFRGRGLAKALGDRLLARLHGLGIVGRVREPVLTHPATQKIALAEGATVVGAFISMTHPIQQVGITDGVEPIRGSLSVAYSALQPLAPAVLSVPAPYESMVRRVLDAAAWPRELAPTKREHDLPRATVVSTAFNDVTVAGPDLPDELHTALQQMQRAGAEYAQVRLPANQPGLSTVAAGLPELGLGYAALIPAFRPDREDAGDVLVTQWLADPEVDASSWAFATDDVRSLILAIVDQVRDVGARGGVRQKRAAQRAQLFAQLEG